MPEFLTLLPPSEARDLLFQNLPNPRPLSQAIRVDSALGRITSEDVLAPHPLPAFPRSTVDGYAVHARDTFGVSDTLPGYLPLLGEVPMGAEPGFELPAGQCALIHTGGMLPTGTDAVVMLEYTQSLTSEIEIFRPVAPGENVLRVGEDVAQGQIVIPRATRLRPAEIGGLMALGINKIRVANKVKCSLISTGDEIIKTEETPGPGQVRDINTHTLSALVNRVGGQPYSYGIVPDSRELLLEAAARALSETDLLVITAGSSASTRDMTADIIAQLGKPGVLVHGINTRPGKPTILGVCQGKAVIGLPGNPVSALVNGMLFVVPVIEYLSGLSLNRPQASVRAQLTVNIASQAGREDWQPARLLPSETGWLVEPVFGKSNLIFSLAAADGLIKISPAVTGLSAGEIVEVILM